MNSRIRELYKRRAAARIRRLASRVALAGSGARFEVEHTSRRLQPQLCRREADALST